MRWMLIVGVVLFGGPALADDPQTRCKTMTVDAYGNSIISDCAKPKPGSIAEYIRDSNKGLPSIAHTDRSRAGRLQVMEHLRQEREHFRPDPVVQSRPRREYGI